MDSLRQRVRELREALRDLDRREQLGRFAETSSGRAGYRVGRWLGGAWRATGRGVRRLFGRADAAEVQRLRLQVESLERRLAERRAAAESKS